MHINNQLGPVRSQRAQLVRLITMMLVLPLTRVHPLEMPVVLMPWGIFRFGMMASLPLSLNGSML